MTVGGAFSVSQPPQMRARIAQVKADLRRCAMAERYFVDRGVDAWLKEDAAAPLCGG
jgi:hypothetical protein